MSPHLPRPRRPAALRAMEQAAPAPSPRKGPSAMPLWLLGERVLPLPRLRPPWGPRPIALQLVWMAGTFGSEWQASFHSTHSLFASPPVVFCIRCGRQSSARSHLLGMRAICLAAHGEVPRGSTAASRRNALAEGRNPLRQGAPLQSTAVQLPTGTHH